MATGATLDEIAAYFDVAPRTIDNWIKHPKVVALYKKAKVKAKLKVGQTLFQKASNGDLGAIIWYEKTRCGYSEKQVQEILTDKPTINVIHTTD